ncbi:FMRFamide-related peptides [Bacillus rossius redtenbacheri]|uniref:FMRFamide-related peptides n=1 Tax=Bacillus rossius redtenbacheri TaxID=93214 RepID=UPI002FDEC4EF
MLLLTAVTLWFAAAMSQPEAWESPRADLLARAARASLELQPDDDSYARLDRGRAGNFVRLGRWRDDNFLRFGRRPAADTFIRFGRDKPQNYIRFGRGKADSFIRLGRDQVGLELEGLGRQTDRSLEVGKRTADEASGLQRPRREGAASSTFGRGKLADSNFIRLGRGKRSAPEDELDDDPVVEDPRVYEYPGLAADLPAYVLGPELSLLPPPSGVAKR